MKQVYLSTNRVKNINSELLTFEYWDTLYKTNEVDIKKIVKTKDNKIFCVLVAIKKIEN